VAGRDGPITRTAPKPAPILGTRAHLERLLRNLLDNAERHVKSTISVTVEVRRALVVLHVVDGGPGIPEADRERVFERFTRLDEARTSEDGGSGLGLAIARDIAVRHGSRLRVGDSAGGAHFVATFPRHTDG
jgi:signal transduction histidine kinase